MKAFSLYEIEDSGYINVTSLDNVFEYMGLDTKTEDYSAIMKQVKVEMLRGFLFPFKVYHPKGMDLKCIINNISIRGAQDEFFYIH